MKNIWYLFCMFLGLLSVVLLIVMVSFFDRLSSTMRIYGFIGIGYLGTISFTYGFLMWKKSHRT